MVVWLANTITTLLAGAAMAWYNVDEQARLWTAFMRYANVYPEVLSRIPEDAYVLLIPKHDLFDEHEGIARFLTRSNPEITQRIAFIYLELADYYLPGMRSRAHSVTGISVEFSSEGRARRSTSER